MKERKILKKETENNEDVKLYQAGPINEEV